MGSWFGRQHNLRWRSAAKCKVMHFFVFFFDFGSREPIPSPNKLL
ncbi:hypothetical protein HanIR_Chr05g0214941 [Helianthus annuus]|nr:hypothetical protein HanIR_Chr05g0214941 [Helianthus annuus]